MKLTGRTHFSRKKIEEFNRERVNNYIDSKPKGFWYQLDNCLLQWGEIDFGNYVYDVKIDEKYFTSIFDTPNPSKILRISKIKELKEFNDSYEVRLFYNSLIGQNDDFDFEIEGIDFVNLNFPFEEVDTINQNIYRSLNNKYKDKVKSGVILNINSSDELNDFAEKYGKREYYNLIDWSFVSSHYSGIEIVNFDKMRKKIRKYNWFSSFDFSCGCVWNPKMVEIEYLGEIDEFEISPKSGKRC